MIANDCLFELCYLFIYNLFIIEREFPVIFIANFTIFSPQTKTTTQRLKWRRKLNIVTRSVSVASMEFSK